MPSVRVPKMAAELVGAPAQDRILQRILDEVWAVLKVVGSRLVLEIGWAPCGLGNVWSLCARCHSGVRLSLAAIRRISFCAGDAKLVIVTCF